MKNSIFLILLAFSAVSCFKIEEPLAPFRGNAKLITQQIEQYESFYDFETNSIIDWHPTDFWSLGFTCGERDFTIITNSGAHWFLLKTGKVDMNATIQYPEKTIWRYDEQSKFPDSTAASGWIKFNNSDTLYLNEVYLLGKYTGSSYSKIFRLKFLKVNSSEYSFCYSSSNTPETIDTISILKNPDKNFVYFSFDSMKIEDIEPDKYSYDLVFCPYYAIATELGITAPYLVRGVFLNTFETEAVIDSVTKYENIDSTMVLSEKFTRQRDVVGFNWKEVSINTGSGNASYKIRSNYSYIIRTWDGNYYKMRFIGYELDGENGYPSFEFEKLNTQ